MISRLPASRFFCSIKAISRAKACAGGLTVKAVKALRYSIDPVVRASVRRVRLEGEGSSTFVKEPRADLRDDSSV